MGDALKKRKLGPFSKHRLAVYAALDAIMQDKPCMTVADLLDAAVSKAKADWPLDPAATGETTGQPKQDLWSIVRKFMEHLLTKAGVLLTAEGEPIGRDWSTAFAPVANLSDDWQAAADGLLVLGILEQFNDVALVDVKNLARVLCFTADSASQKRAQAAVTYLLKKGLVEQTAEGTLRTPVEGTREPERLRVVAR